MYKEFLLVTNTGVYWFDTEEELIDKRNRFENEGSNINFCGKIKVQMEYCSTRNELVFV